MFTPLRKTPKTGKTRKDRKDRKSPINPKSLTAKTFLREFILTLLEKGFTRYELEMDMFAGRWNSLARRGIHIESKEISLETARQLLQNAMPVFTLTAAGVSKDKILSCSAEVRDELFKNADDVAHLVGHHKISLEQLLECSAEKRKELYQNPSEARASLNLPTLRP